MNFKKLLGISSIALLSSCTVKEVLPEFPKMSFKQKIIYHARDDYLSYEEAKDLLNYYNKIKNTPYSRKYKYLGEQLKNYCNVIRDPALAYESKYVSVGLLLPLFWFDHNSSSEASKLELELENFLDKHVEVYDEQIYPKTYFGTWLGGFIGLLAPMIMQLLVSKYTKRKTEESDTAMLFLNGFASIADFAHPSVFWVRLGFPIIWELLMLNDEKQRRKYTRKKENFSTISF